MKWIYLILILALSACAQLERLPATSSSESYTRHVVLDIDWTIVAEIKNPSQALKSSPRVIQVENHYYYLNEGVEEFIEDVLEKKDVSLSFFSGGPRKRNLALLEKIRLSDGRSLKDVAFKILSREDLVATGASAETPFSKRYKKDLTKVTENLEQLIMFDDTAGFTLDSPYSQKDHVFFTGTSFEFFEDFNDALKAKGKYVPKSFDEWQIDRRKFYVLKKAFLKAYALSKNGDVSFREAMKNEEARLEIAALRWNATSYSYYKEALKDALLRDQKICTDAVQSILGL